MDGTVRSHSGQFVQQATRDRVRDRIGGSRRRFSGVSRRASGRFTAGPRTLYFSSPTPSLLQRAYPRKRACPLGDFPPIRSQAPRDRIA